MKIATNYFKIGYKKRSKTKVLDLSHLSKGFLTKEIVKINGIHSLTRSDIKQEKLIFYL